MFRSTDEELFDSINPSPRDEVEGTLHTQLAAAWSELGRGALYGIKFYTAGEEARLRNPDFQGDPSTIDPRWIGTGPVTAMVTVDAKSIGRGADYLSLQTRLAAAAPEVAVELVPWNLEVPADHKLATLEG